MSIVAFHFVPLQFILPAIVHINNQPLLQPGDGPIVSLWWFLLCNTRHLSFDHLLPYKYWTISALFCGSLLIIWRAENPGGALSFKNNFPVQNKTYLALFCFRHFAFVQQENWPSKCRQYPLSMEGILKWEAHAFMVEPQKDLKFENWKGVRIVWF